jgi:hypothetical protein
MLIKFEPEFELLIEGIICLAVKVEEKHGKIILYLLLELSLNPNSA